VTKHTKLGVKSDFFQKPREGSRIKQKIVTDYFVAYNRVMAPGPKAKVGYADLFAGPGFYMDEKGVKHKSIPILVCEAVIGNENCSGRRSTYGLTRVIRSITKS